MTRSALALTFTMAALCMAACGGEGERFLRGWERDGRAVHPSELRLERGPEDHCEWGSVLFLGLDWPHGQDGREDSKRYYVRDPDGLMAGISDRAFDSDADLPDDAAQTPFENEAGVELWLADDGSTAYLVDGGTVEAWPALDEPAACA